MGFIGSRWVQAARKAQEIASAVRFARKHRAALGTCVYIDVGARWGLSRRWRAVYRTGVLSPVLFEPDPEEAARLQAAMPRAIVHRVALFDHDGDATLHITANPGDSSLLVPVDPVGARRVERRINVKTTTLDAIRPRIPKPDFIKLDVQGAEMKILSAGTDTLREVLCAEIEVKLVPFYRGEALFHEIFDFMRSAGFGLVAFRPMGLYDGEILEGNAYFCREPTDEKDALKLGLWRRTAGIPSHGEYVTLSG